MEPSSLYCLHTYGICFKQWLWVSFIPWLVEEILCVNAIASVMIIEHLSPELIPPLPPPNIISRFTIANHLLNHQTTLLTHLPPPFSTHLPFPFSTEFFF
ncbi:hypothetical protein L1049_009728 [Liquidambar formosana]|uniref:Uncharacterized protein n=1 Tax=Liquidambar formosana TaxID=63359 RepID=A0AAP0N8Y1_LIQFO